MPEKTTAKQDLSIKEILSSLGSCEEGLSSSAVPFQRMRYGANILPKVKPRSVFWCFFKQFTSPIIIILEIAGTIQLFLHQYKEAFAIFTVLIFNAILGFFQERRASQSMQALELLSTPTSKVIRDGKLITVKTVDIVVGDLLYLDSGTKIGADARLIESHSLYVDESMFTGESLPVHKKVSHEAPGSSILDSPNMVFGGTIVTKGRGKACVTAVGPNTQTASIIETLQGTKPPKAPLEIKIGRFARKIIFFTFILICIMFGIGFLHKLDLVNLIMTGLSVMISAIPEGLPIAITAVLSFGLLQLAKKQAIVKDLSTVETLGSTSVICTDKTGTLTLNKMEVRELFSDEGDGKNQALTVMWLCSETHLSGNDFTGDPLEAALMRYAKQLRPKLEKERAELTHPYESELQKMGVTWKTSSGKEELWKGSFEAISPHCTTMWRDGKLVPFLKDVFQEELLKMTHQGLRVLALSYNKTMVGLVGLEDPPREDVASVVQSCKKAGIRVILITGDHPETALHVAQKTAIPIDEKTPYLTGSQIQTLSDEELFSIVNHTTIYARVSPTDKFRIVSQLQKHDEIVAMTGDGINDAPSIKKANVGIAMGTGSDVAKQAASMILLDNSFTIIYEAIKQGRDIFKSIQQTLLYLVTTSVSDVFTIIAATILGLPLPLLPLHILFINMVTDGTLTIPLALEKEHGDSMNHPPRKLFLPFLSKTMYLRGIIGAVVMMIGTVGMYSYTLKTTPKSAQTVAFITLSLFQLFNAFNARSTRRSLFFTFKRNESSLTKVPFFSNTLLLAVSAIAVLLQVIVVEMPFLQSILHTEDLSFKQWLLIILTAFSIVIYTEIDKAFHFFLLKKDP